MTFFQYCILFIFLNIITSQRHHQQPKIFELNNSSTVKVFVDRLKPFSGSTKNDPNDSGQNFKLIKNTPIHPNTTPNNHPTTQPPKSMDTTNLIRDLVDEELHSPYRRLVEEILDPDYYEKTVHPQIDHTSSTRINLSMSLYQILEVNERSQSIVVNVWMVQEWFDQFLNWSPEEYDGIKRIIVPYDEIWVPG